MPTTTFYGKGVALAGMKTACGALLIATQLTNVVQLGGGVDFEAVDATGAPVDIVYRINAGKVKLAESTLARNGATQAFPLNQKTELVFWKAP